MWTYDADGLSAAAEATAPHLGGTPTGRVVTFCAGHLTLAALNDALIHLLTELEAD